MTADWTAIARIRKDRRSGACNGGWAYDAYPELETLDAHRAITIAEIKGPAVITCIHVTQQLSEGRDSSIPRGIILEIYFNEVPSPAVRVPLSDFFADGCNGGADHFSSLYVEKAPEAYNCFIPMPFEKSARVVLINETRFNFSSYSFVEYEELPEWDVSLGYFHATWSRSAFQLNGSTDRHFFHAEGAGHLLGRAWSVCTDEPLFKGFHFIMEGNNEFRIDGEAKPRMDYLGTEDSFAFSWGFKKPFCGLYNGMNHISNETPSMLSIYRFYGANAIRFNRSIDLRVDWSNEWLDQKTPWMVEFQKNIRELNAGGQGWVDYATTYYWYQDTVGHAHEPMLPLEERCGPILHPRA